MKRLALVWLIPLAGCSYNTNTLPAPATPSTPIASAADKVVLTGAKGLIFANLIYQSLGTPVAVGLEQGVIKGETAVRVKALSRTTVNALQAGRNAATDADKARYANLALSALETISSLTGIPLPKL